MSPWEGHTSLWSSFSRSILWEAEAERELGKQGFTEGNIYERRGGGRIGQRVLPGYVDPNASAQRGAPDLTAYSRTPLGEKPHLAQSGLQRRAELHLKAEVDPEGANSWVLSARYTVQLGSESFLAGTRHLVPPRPDCALGCKRKTFRMEVGPRLSPQEVLVVE